ncbi:MAG: hypothetical protein KF799_14820 [Bdellovibrionales bacterium]|nr:hypothetical protein [Bdellovibrionales bacterium]
MRFLFSTILIVLAAILTSQAGWASGSRCSDSLQGASQPLPLTASQRELLLGEDGLRALLAVKFLSPSVFNAEASRNFPSIDRQKIKWTAAKNIMIGEVIAQLLAEGKLLDFIYEFKTYAGRVAYQNLYPGQIALIERIDSSFVARQKYDLSFSRRSRAEILGNLTERQKHALFGGGELRDIISSTFSTTSNIEVEAIMHFPSIERGDINWDADKNSVIDEVIEQAFANHRFSLFLEELVRYADHSSILSKKRAVLADLIVMFKGE